jgi:hypothetical protein
VEPDWEPKSVEECIEEWAKKMENDAEIYDDWE